MSVAGGAPLPLIRIDASRREPLLDLPELWRYRELLAFLAWRDVRVRYHQTAIGLMWALIEPFVSAIVFTLLFHSVAGLSTGDTPYALYTYAGMVVWNFYSRALRDVTRSFVVNAPLVRKIYFPRLCLPLASLLATAVDVACAMLMYVGMMAWYGLMPPIQIMLLPVWLLLAGAGALGAGLALGSINVQYRDISQALPFLVQIGLLATPVAYPLKSVPAAWQTVYALNPMVAVVEGARWSLLPGQAFPGWLLLPSVAMSALLIVLGLWCYRAAQRNFADVI